MQRRSPLFVSGNIEKSILIIYGMQDARVAPQQSLGMINALKEDGADVRSVQIDTEGHSIRWRHNWVRLAREIEVFLAQHLGGQSQGR